MTDKIILIPPYMCVAPPQTEGRWIIPLLLYRRGAEAPEVSVPVCRQGWDYSVSTLLPRAVLLPLF